MQAKNRFAARQEAAVKRLAKVGPFVTGTLVRIKHPTCKHVAHRLTFKVKGKTKAVYVKFRTFSHIYTTPPQHVMRYRRI